ncbi:MAG: hypothetical protein ACLFVP_05710 [Candidatus Bathyarchaeia archaeon]
MTSKEASGVYRGDVDRDEACNIVQEICEGCTLERTKLGSGAHIEAPKLDDFRSEGYKILIDIYAEDGSKMKDVEDFVQEMGLGYRYTKREWGTYLMVYKPRLSD